MRLTTDGTETTDGERKAGSAHPQSTGLVPDRIPGLKESGTDQIISDFSCHCINLFISDLSAISGFMALALTVPLSRNR
jgi:hypothetical protein